MSFRHTTVSSKKAARRQRGARVVCTCGTQTFQNHLSAHVDKPIHDLRLAQNNPKKRR